ncbi:MAG: NADH-quinone oxidoreductase subunit J [Actinomycetia bacterium]|nr:NADH-quinone oxidoreductase subunit J [Actinomycetes bacterium]
MLNTIAFVVLGAALILGAFSVVTVRNVMHAAYWLLEVSVVVAGLIYFLSAEYVAILQLLVYVGAVGMLVIFTIMLTRRDPRDDERPDSYSYFALAAALLLFAALAFSVVKSPTLVARPGAASTSLVDFGLQMFSTSGWALGFEIASLLLTVALIAAVWWTKERDD